MITHIIPFSSYSNIPWTEENLLVALCSEEIDKAHNRCIYIDSCDDAANCAGDNCSEQLCPLLNPYKLGDRCEFIVLDESVGPSFYLEYPEICEECRYILISRVQQSPFPHLPEVVLAYRQAHNMPIKE